MAITGYQIAGGYYTPRHSPQIVNVVNDMIADGWMPYGSPLLSDSAGWVSQPMVLTGSTSITGYQIVTGYDGQDQRTPVIPIGNAGWTMLGDTQWLKSHYYLQAWVNGVPFNDILPIDLTSEVTGVLPILNGGTGSSTAPGARNNLGFTAIGIGGAGSALTALNWQTFDFVPGARYAVLSDNMTNTPAGITVPAATITIVEVAGYDGTTRHVNVWFSTTTSSNYRYSQVRVAGTTGSRTFTVSAFWTNRNTTVDANGFIKSASPIVNLYGNGTVTVNDEAAGVTGAKLATGQYKLSGTLGLNADALWWIEVPRDVNGQPLLWVDYTVNGDGSILVNTYHRVHPESPPYARNIVMGVNNGDARDIPSGKYLSIRVNVPG